MTTLANDAGGIEELSPTIEVVDESISSVNSCLQALLTCSQADVVAKVGYYDSVIMFR